MTDTTMREMLSETSGEDSIQILDCYIELAKDVILRKMYPFGTSKTTIPDKYRTIQFEIACYLINKRGGEGETSHNESSVSRTYESAYVPESMLKQITSYVSLV